MALGSPAEPLDDSLLSSWVVEFSVTGGGLVAKSCLTLATPWAVAFQARLSIGFSRQEYQSGLPFPSLGDLSDPGIEPRSSTLQADALPPEPPGKPNSWKVLPQLCLHRFTSQTSPYLTLAHHSTKSVPGQGHQCPPDSSIHLTHLTQLP